MRTDYVVRFKGDYSALAKDLEKINASTRKLEDDEVIIKLNYDGNIKEFNKVFDQISKQHPELGIQFQYNVNQKMLDGELDKLKKLTDIKLDVDENRVTDKLKSLSNEVESALQQGLSKDVITKRLKDFYGYYNTAVKAGAKNVEYDFDQLGNKLFEALNAKGLSDVFDKVWDLNDREAIQFVEVATTVNDAITEIKGNVDDLKDSLKSLEARGATKSGLPSDLQKFEDEVKILRSEIEDMQKQLGNLSGEAFDKMTESIKQTNEQLSEALEKIKTLASGGTINVEATDTGDVEKAAEEATKKAADALKKAQDSNSPAELTKPLGKDFGEGYAEGIKEAMSDIVEACKEMVLGAYNALKEAMNSKDSGDIDFTEGFIEKFKNNIKELAPSIQEEINSVFSKINIDDTSAFENVGQKIVDSIIDGIHNANPEEKFSETITNIINNAFSSVVLDSAVRDFLRVMQTSIDEAGDFRLSHFSVDSDSIIFQVQNALNNGTYSINVGGVVNDLATTLNTSAENVRTSFIDAIKWMRQANEWQKKNDKGTDERTILFNSKTGKFSNPTVVGDMKEIKNELKNEIIEYYKSKGVDFDTDLHWHRDYDYVAPSDKTGDLGNFFQRAFTDGIDKFIIAAQKELAVFDFSKLASSSDELNTVFKDWIDKNKDKVKEAIKYTVGGINIDDRIKNDATDFTELFLEYFDVLYNRLSKQYEEQLRMESRIITPALGEESIKSIFKNLENNEIFDLFDEEQGETLKDRFKETYKSLTSLFTVSERDSGKIDDVMRNILGSIENSLLNEFNNNNDVDASKLQSIVMEAVIENFKNIKAPDSIKSKILNEVFESVNKQIQEALLSKAYLGQSWEYAKDFNANKDYAQKAGSMAMKQLMSENPLIGKLVKYYTHDEFEKEFGAKLPAQDVQQPIDDMLSNYTISGDIQEQFEKIGKQIIDSITAGLQNGQSDFAGSLSNILIQGSKEIDYNQLSSDIYHELRDWLNEQQNSVPLRIEHFDINTNDIIVSIQDALNKQTFNVNIGGTIQELATALNTSADNVRMSFIDAIKMIRQANEWQKKNDDKTHERALFFNSKTGEFSNPTVVGNEESVGSLLTDPIKEYYKRLGVLFDTNLHWHQDEDFAAPSYVTKWSTEKKDNKTIITRSGDLASFFGSAFKDGIDKFIVAAQKEFAVFDFSKIASSAKELDNYLIQYINDHIDEISETLQYNKWADNDNLLGDPRKTVALYITEIYKDLWDNIKLGWDNVDFSSEILDQKAIREALTDFSSELVNGISRSFISLHTGEVLPINEVFSDVIEEIKDELISVGAAPGIIDSVDDIFEKFITETFHDIFMELGLKENIGIDDIRKQVVNSVNKVLDNPSKINKQNISDLGLEEINIKSAIIETFKDVLQDDLFNPKVLLGKSEKELQEAGSLAMKKMISENDLIGKLVRYLTPEEFEKEFGANISKATPKLIKHYTGDDLIDWYQSATEDIPTEVFGDFDKETFYKWRDNLLSYFPELLESQAQQLFDYMRQIGIHDQDFDDRFLLKINGYVKQNAYAQQNSQPQSALLQDFQQQLQNAIDESGQYVIKVYGELVEDFKSRLQNAIDETGIYHVDIEGWLADSFHDGIQRDIDGQEKYVIEVKGRLFDTFKEVLQEAIDSLGAFPIEVKPYMAKGGEIEEVDLPSTNNQTPKLDVVSGRPMPKGSFIPSDYVQGMVRSIDDIKAQLHNTTDLSDAEIERKAIEIRNAEIDAINEYSDDFIRLIHRSKPNNLQDIIDNGFQTRYDNLAATLSMMNQTIVPNKDYGIYNSGSFVVIDIPKTEFSKYKYNGDGVGLPQDTTGYADYGNKPEYIEAETKALLSKKQVVEQLRSELQLTKKAAEDLFDEQGYEKTNGKYQIEQAALDELITSLKEKKQVEDSTKTPDSSVANAMQSEADAVNAAIEAEKKKFDELKKKIDTTIPNAIKKKNEAFKAESELVAKLVGGESKAFDGLKNSIDGVTSSVKEQGKVGKESNKKGKVSSNEPDKDALLQQHYTDLRKDSYQSIGQKSDVQKQMSDYYSQLEKESSKAYSDAERKANSLLDKVKKLQNSNKFTQEFKDELSTAETELTSFIQQLESGAFSFEEVGDKVTALADKIENTLAKKAFNNVKLAAEKSLTNVGLKIDQIIAKNSAMGKDFENRFKNLRKRLDLAKSIDDVRKLMAEVNMLESEIISAGKTGRSFIDQIKQRLKDINARYIAQYFSFQDIIRYARQAAQNIIGINDAFIELSKVSNTSLKDLEADFQAYASIAKSIGGTITDTINATADWARMGYNLPDSKQLANIAMLFKNVGDGISIDEANESLISTLQAYQMGADEAEHIVDVFNEVYS